MHFEDFQISYVEQDCHVLVTMHHYLNLSAHTIEGKLKILERNQKSEKILRFYLIFCVFMDFYCDVVKRNVHVWLGCIKTPNPGIGTVLHCPPDVHKCGTVPLLLVTVLMLSENFITIRAVVLEVWCKQTYKEAKRMSNILCKYFAK